MSNAHTDVIDDIEIKFDLPKKYKVLIHNDDFTPMEFVEALLIEIFAKTPDQAVQLTLDVHHNGKGLAGIYYYEIADQKVQESMTVARAHGYPLKLDLEQA